MNSTDIRKDLLDLNVLELRSLLTFNTHLELGSVLRRSEIQTLRWVEQNLNKPSGVVIIHSFKLPLQAALKAQYRKFFSMAYRIGGDNVVDQIRKDTSWTISFAALPSNRIRVKGDLACDRLVSKIEGDLKFAWMRNTYKGNMEALRLHTNEVFDKVIGIRNG